MDSGLLNAFHDDAFDGNYVKYDRDTQFWTSENEALGLQLIETLHGILPNTPTEVERSILEDVDCPLDIKKEVKANAITYEDYEDISPCEIANKSKLISHRTFGEVVEYGSEVLPTDSSSDDEEKKVCGKLGHAGELQDTRSCSRSTFRSRTDSSSIGDYESHTSDYDYDSDATEFNSVQRETSLILKEGVVKKVTLRSDANELKSVESADPFAMQLDISTFDLAAFITEDDQVFENHSALSAKFTPHPVNYSQVVSSIYDSDSDVIVDVETVENEDVDLLCQRKGNEGIKVDVLEKNDNQQIECDEVETTESNFAKNFSVIPSNRQSDFFKRKFGLGQNLNIHCHSISCSSKSNSECKLYRSKKNSIAKKNRNKQAPEKKINRNVEKQHAILNEKEASNNILDQKQTISNYKSMQFFPNKLKDYVSEKRREAVLFRSEETALPIKRKLNIEEYKKRRELGLPKQPILGSSIQTTSQTIMKPTFKPMISKKKKTAAVNMVVKCLKENLDVKGFKDPIIEAKNKVLRIQELKKAKQIKIIDSTVSSKVGRVTKLLPIKDFVKDSYKTYFLEKERTNSEYEEITIVSTGCNTDIIVPPHRYFNTQLKGEKYESLSLLKSSMLLVNVNNSIETARSDENVQILNNSLIVNIQDVMVRQISILPNTNKATQTSTSSSEHGEDKVVMHLRKDRIRKVELTQSTQTDWLPEFSALPLANSQFIGVRCSSSFNRKREVHKIKNRIHRSSFSSDQVNCDGRRSKGNETMSNHKIDIRKRSVSSSCTDSDEYSRQCRQYNDFSSPESGLSSSKNISSNKSFDHVYRSHCKKTSRSSRGYFKGHVERNISAPAVEERRIVYVGRIEQDTTKEILRRKFIGYGPIKQISIHCKDTGKKYGFVTYQKSEDAFKVIDSGLKDAAINMYDISFGGRRAFCRASYADLDNAGINKYQSNAVPPQIACVKEEEDSFEALLLKVKAKLNKTVSIDAISTM